MVKGLQIISDKHFRVNKVEFHHLVKEILNKLDKKIEALSVNFVDQNTILSVNKEHLNHDYTTDIITFNYSGDNNNLEGEIIISYNDAYENSEKYKVSFESEIGRLVIHGILHLVGFDDIDAGNKRKMKKVENQLVESFSHTLKTRLKIHDS